MISHQSLIFYRQLYTKPLKKLTHFFVKKINKSDLSKPGFVPFETRTGPVPLPGRR